MREWKNLRCFGWERTHLGGCWVPGVVCFDPSGEFQRGEGSDGDEGIKEMSTYLLDCKDLSFTVLLE